MTPEQRAKELQTTFNSIGWDKIIRPSIDDMIKQLEMHWINGTRPSGEENISDDVIKGRIWALVWLNGWEARIKVWLHNHDAAQKMESVEDE